MKLIHCALSQLECLLTVDGFCLLALKHQLIKSFIDAESNRTSQNHRECEDLEPPHQPLIISS